MLYFLNIFHYYCFIYPLLFSCLSPTTQPLPALQPAPRLIRVCWLAEPVDCVRQNNWFTVKCKSVILNNEVCGSGTNWRLDLEHGREGAGRGRSVEGKLFICVVAHSRRRECVSRFEPSCRSTGTLHLKSIPPYLCMSSYFIA